MTCDHAACSATATVKTRFGDGVIDIPGYRKRQTFVHYCDDHLVTVEAMFNLCQTTALDRPNGPLPVDLPAGTLDLVAR